MSAPIAIGHSSQPTTSKPVTGPSKPTTGDYVDALPTPVGWAALIATDQPKLAVLAELGENAPRVTQGYGGFETIDRRQRIGLTVWTGFQPIGIDLDLLFDDFDAGRSVEASIDVLEALAGRGRRANGGQPPAIRVDTAGVMPFDRTVFPGEDWIIQDLSWSDDETIVNDNGNRVRAAVTVSLLQHVTDQRLQDRALAARRKLKGTSHAARGRYTAREGDTLMSIARKKLGDAGRWPDLAKLNGIRDPRSVRSGAVIRLPR